jgi:hypothetical protein
MGFNRLACIKAVYAARFGNQICVLRPARPPDCSLPQLVRLENDERLALGTGKPYERQLP